jgi:hypothetical protein
LVKKYKFTEPNDNISSLRQQQKILRGKWWQQNLNNH